MDRPRSLYLHVPFCPQICPYCDFHKMRRSEDLVERYLTRLEREARELHARFPGALDTIYLGGGTPSHLTDAELARIVAALGATWGFPAARETTLEADPGTFAPARLAWLRGLGFDRLSIGLQSTQDAALAFLGRSHTGAEGLQALAWALAAGFEVSADVIAALPARVPRDLTRDLDAVADLGVPHVSVYTLTIEPFTPFARRGVRVDDDRAADDFERTDAHLGARGYERYEVSSHALPGHEAVHNATYWSGAPFLALGPSAAGYLPTGADADGRDLGARVTNPPLRTWLEGAPPAEERPGAEDYALERLLTGLRTRRGVDLGEIRDRAGLDVRTRWRAPLAAMTGAGMLEIDGNRLRATECGLAQLDGVLGRFFAA